MTTPLVRIVDDDADARSSSSFFLSMMGLEIKEYDSAYRFLEEDDMNRPGCIILDVRMPDMTGMELQVKLNQKDCRLPIIFLSGHGELDMAVHALKRGASDFLQKSISHQAGGELCDRKRPPDKRNTCLTVSHKD